MFCYLLKLLLHKRKFSEFCTENCRNFVDWLVSTDAAIKVIPDKPAQYRKGLETPFWAESDQIFPKLSPRRRDGPPGELSGPPETDQPAALMLLVRRMLRILTILTVRNGIKQPARRVSEAMAGALGYRGRASGGSAGAPGYRGRPHSIPRRPGTSVRVALGGRPRVPLPPPGRPIFTTWVM